MDRVSTRYATLGTHIIRIMAPSRNSAERRAKKRLAKRAIAVLTFTLGCYRVFREFKERERERKRLVSYERGVRTAALRDLFYSRFKSLDSAFFLAMFRCTRYQYEQIYESLGPYLQLHVHPNNEIARRNSNRRCLTVDEKICIALRVAGGATSTDAAWGFGCHRTLVKRVFLNFLVGMARSSVGIIRYPTSQAELQRIADDFQAKTSGNKATYYHGCAGAGDGLAVRIKAVSLRECINPLAYINRKGFYSINLQSINDSRMRLLYVNLETQGATHDSTAFFATDFSKQFLNSNTAPPVDRHGRAFWLALDDAYGQHNSRIVTPWPGRNLIISAPFKDAFNYHLSGGYRNTAERTYGILIARFGIFWRPLDFELRLIPFVVYSLCRLHNFLIDIGVNEECPVVATGLGYYGSRKNDKRRTQDEVGGYGRPTGYDSFTYHQRMVADDMMELERVRGRSAVASIRDNITANLEMLSIRRPGDKVGRLRST
jgi:hypothetical protein